MYSDSNSKPSSDTAPTLISAPARTVHSPQSCLALESTNDMTILSDSVAFLTSEFSHLRDTARKTGSTFRTVEHARTWDAVNRDGKEAESKTTKRGRKESDTVEWIKSTHRDFLEVFRGEGNSGPSALAINIEDPASSTIGNTEKTAKVDSKSFNQRQRESICRHGDHGRGGGGGRGDGSSNTDAEQQETAAVRRSYRRTMEWINQEGVQDQVHDKVRGFQDFIDPFETTSIQENRGSRVATPCYPAEDGTAQTVTTPAPLPVNASRKEKRRSLWKRSLWRRLTHPLRSEHPLSNDLIDHGSTLDPQREMTRRKERIARLSRATLRCSSTTETNVPISARRPLSQIDPFSASGGSTYTGFFPDPLSQSRSGSRAQELQGSPLAEILDGPVGMVDFLSGDGRFDSFTPLFTRAVPQEVGKDIESRGEHAYRYKNPLKGEKTRRFSFVSSSKRGTQI